MTNLADLAHCIRFNMITLTEARAELNAELQNVDDDDLRDALMQFLMRASELEQSTWGR